MADEQIYQIPQYIDFPNMAYYDKRLKNYIKEQLSNISIEYSDCIVQSTYLEFPTIGNSKKLYIDKSNGKIYRWDENESKYYCLTTTSSEGSLENYTQINGGDSTLK